MWGESEVRNHLCRPVQERSAKVSRNMAGTWAEPPGGPAADCKSEEGNARARRSTPQSQVRSVRERFARIPVPEETAGTPIQLPTGTDTGATVQEVEDIGKGKKNERENSFACLSSSGKRPLEEQASFSAGLLQRNLRSNPIRELKIYLQSPATWRRVTVHRFYNHTVDCHGSFFWLGSART